MKPMNLLRESDEDDDGVDTKKMWRKRLLLVWKTFHAHVCHLKMSHFLSRITSDNGKPSLE